LPEQNCNKILAKALKVKYNASIHGKNLVSGKPMNVLRLPQQNSNNRDAGRQAGKQASRQRFNLLVLE
jgi:hypothetical protein